MLPAQNPKLLLVDEPAAGRTDEETHKTGELPMKIPGQHSIIVIEQDMVFVRQTARTVHRSPPGQRPLRRHGGRSAKQRARYRGVPGQDETGTNRQRRIRNSNSE